MKQPAGAHLMSQPNLAVNNSSPLDLQALDKTSAMLQQSQKEISLTYLGNPVPIEQALTTLVAGGHALLCGPTGTGKTTLTKALNLVLNLNTTHITCTPDQKVTDLFAPALPQAPHALHSSTSTANATGNRSANIPAATGQLLVLDEIDRAAPQVRATVIQMMQHQMFTRAGQSYSTPSPFHIMATTSQREEDDLYLLPDNGLDLFLCQIAFPPPSQAEEKEILTRITQQSREAPCRRMNPPDLLAAQQLAREIPLSESLIENVIRLIHQTRPETSSIQSVKSHVARGPSPRAAQHMLLALKARSVLHNRPNQNIEDIRTLAPAILPHRLALTFTAQTETAITPQDIIEEACASL